MSAESVNQKLTYPRDAHDDEMERRVRRSALIARFFESRLRLSQLRMLVAIADLGQLKRVADALSVTPPAISKQLAEFEEALGEPLLTRIGNRLEFTPVGDLLVRRARDVLAQLERARIEVDELCSGVAGSLGIGVVPTMASLLFPTIVLTLKHRAPNVSARLHEGRFSALAPMLTDGGIDLVFARDTTQDATDAFSQVTVMSDPFIVVCRAQHPLAAVKHQLVWKDLHGVPWIVPMRGSRTFMHLESLLLRHGLTIPRGSIETASWSSKAGLVQAHPFVALFPTAYARKFLLNQNFALLPLSTEGIQDTINAVWRKDDDSPLIPLLVEAIGQQA